jgi:hypothetical protein
MRVNVCGKWAEHANDFDPNILKLEAKLVVSLKVAGSAVLAVKQETTLSTRYAMRLCMAATCGPK